MYLIAVTLYLMECSIFVSLCRQIFSFARDNRLPAVSNQLKLINKKIKVPLCANIFTYSLACVLGLLILINSVAADAPSSLNVTINSLAWGVPVLMLILPTEAASRLHSAPFYGKRQAASYSNQLDRICMRCLRNCDEYASRRPLSQSTDNQLR